MNCSVCGCETELILKTRVLNKHEVSYFKCVGCEFIQTEKPYWTDEAYNRAISSLDVGLVFRNLHLNKTVEPIIKKYFDPHLKFLDYGGGYGLFVRLMRDKGFDFYRQDMYCENIFAQYWDVKDLPPKTRFELVTAFEVFEHLANPLEEIKKMFEYADSVLFSTKLQPPAPHENLDQWWYLAPESGQHISFYSKKTLGAIGQHFNRHLYSDGKNFHLLTPQKITANPFKPRGKKKNLLYRGLNRILNLMESSEENDIKLKSFLERDSELAKSKIIKND
jgi:hypothetical protein